MISFTVWITNCCNMRCHYCYEFDKIDRSYRAPEENLDRIIDFIVCKVQEEMQDKNVVINFHGGEPLLEFDRVVHFADKLRNRLKNYSVSYNIVTNGTLLDNEKAKWLNKYMNTISLSIDGEEEMHNANRKYVNGKGTYKDIINNLKNAGLNKQIVRIRMTVNSKTVHALADSISHMVELGFCTIIPSVVYEDQGWNDEKLKYLESQLKKVKLKYQNTNNVMIGMINKQEMKVKTFCGGGITKFDILSNGDVYPCSVVAGLKQYRLGNILTGLEFDTDKLCNIYSTPNKECSGCTYLKYCLGTRCKYLNVISTDDFNKPSEVLCKIENIKYRMYKM